MCVNVGHCCGNCPCLLQLYYQSVYWYLIIMLLQKKIYVPFPKCCGCSWTAIQQPQRQILDSLDLALFVIFLFVALIIKACVFINSQFLSGFPSGHSFRTSLRIKPTQLGCRQINLPASLNFRLALVFCAALSNETWARDSSWLQEHSFLRNKKESRITVMVTWVNVEWL